MTTIAVIGMGEMGSAVARRLIENGAHVVTALQGRSEGTVRRAQGIGADLLDEFAMIDAAEVVLSIVPPGAAATVAEQVLPLLRASRGKPAFIDCNAVAPRTLLDLAQPFVDAGLRFGDGSIIGAAPKPKGPSPRLYLSGALADESRLLASFGLDTRLLSEALGDASALKMSYAGITKGFQALGIAMALGAARNGATDSLITELRESQPQLYGWLAAMLPRMYSKAHRWNDEMREIARFLEPERGSVELFTGAADLYRVVAAHDREGPQSEVITTLEGFAHPGAAQD